MIYIFSSLIVILGFTVISYVPKKQRSKRKAYGYINLSLGIAGLLTLVLSYVICSTAIGRASTDPDWIGWASDMFGIYYNISVPLLLVCLLVIALSQTVSVVLNKKSGGKIARITSIAASAALLILAFFYSKFTENSVLPLDFFILISGIGEAFTMRLTFALETAVKKTEN